MSKKKDAVKEPESEVKKYVQTEDGVLKVIDVKRVSQFELRVLVEGTNLERLSTPEARKLAYEERLNNGMADAGIEPVAGTFVPDEEYAAAKDEGRNVARWHREFRIVQML